MKHKKSHLHPRFRYPHSVLLLIVGAVILLIAGFSSFTYARLQNSVSDADAAEQAAARQVVTKPKSTKQKVTETTPAASDAPVTTSTTNSQSTPSAKPSNSSCIGFGCPGYTPTATPALLIGVVNASSQSRPEDAVCAITMSTTVYATEPVTVTATFKLTSSTGGTPLVKTQTRSLAKNEQQTFTESFSMPTTDERFTANFTASADRIASIKYSAGPFSSYNPGCFPFSTN